MKIFDEVDDEKLEYDEIRQSIDALNKNLIKNIISEKNIDWFVYDKLIK
jgi:hypothetical protein